MSNAIILYSFDGLECANALRGIKCHITLIAVSWLVYLRQDKAMRRDLASALLVLVVAGRTAGSTPAILDGMIVGNKLMHNNQRAPGHFHTFVILGEVTMAFGLMAWLMRREGEALSGINRAAFWVYVAGVAGFVLMFLVSGALASLGTLCLGLGTLGLATDGYTMLIDAYHAVIPATDGRTRCP